MCSRTKREEKLSLGKGRQARVLFFTTGIRAKIPVYSMDLSVTPVCLNLMSNSPLPFY